MKTTLMMTFALLVVVNSRLLLKSDFNQVFQNLKDGNVVTTSCNTVNTSNFTIQLNQTVYAGYLNVDDKAQSGLAFIFYGSKKAQTPADIPKYPTVIWLNGGPGSSSQLGNFLELGPIRIHADGSQTENPHSWDHEYNVMFVDQPIGTGFSSYNSVNDIPTNQSQVGSHFLYALTEFLVADTGCVTKNKLNGLLTSPWFLFGESYAGKYVPSIAQAIIHYNQVAAHTTKIPLKGIGIGDGFTDPLTIMQQMPGYGFSMGLIDFQERAQIEKAAVAGTINIKRGNWLQAMQNFDQVCGGVVDGSGGFNVYDIYSYGNYSAQENQVLKYLDNKTTKATFGFNTSIPFQMSSDAVYKSLSVDFMKSDCVARLEEVLQTIPVIIYNGQSDLIVPNPGTLKWVYKLNHTKTAEFQQLDFSIWQIDGQTVGYKKKAGNLELRIVNKAGHLVPMDQPVSALDLVKSFVEAHK